MAVSMNPFTLRSFYFCWLFWGIGLLAGLPDVQLFSQKAPRFRADVDQVVLYASVYNTEGQLVSDLKQEDFLVTENGTLQQVTYFGLDDIPATVGIVMDNSGSMRDKKDRVDKATDLFLDLNNPENELFLMSFNSESRLDEDFTQDVDDIRDALYNQMVSGGTALYDAISLAVEHAHEGSEPKRVVVVFTDGEDKNSYYTIDEVVQQVEEADILVFIIAFLAQQESEKSGFFGVLKKIKKETVSKSVIDVAEATGGKAYFPNDTKELQQVFEEIAYELRNQYRLSYISNVTEELREDGWRSVRVNIKKARERGLRIRARRGYYIQKAEATTSN
jgi:Ca-activated chloride channel family protein